MHAGEQSGNRGTPDRDGCLVKRIVIKNYKSIAACDVRLGPLSFLVGPNGSGKSNFLDALAFVADSLRDSIDAALDRRGGFFNVCRELDTGAEEFGIRLECETNNLELQYSFALRLDGDRIRISRESCRVSKQGSSTKSSYYVVEDGQIISSSMQHPPAVYSDRLYLIYASGDKCFRSVFEALSGATVYKIDPDSMRIIDKHGTGQKLKRNGANVARIIHHLQHHAPDLKTLIDECMQKILPGFETVECVNIPGDSETLVLLFSEVRPDGTIYRTTAMQMSSGTLRALGILAMLFQIPQRNGKYLPFMAIEEPEEGLHPNALGVLLDSFTYASNSSQIVVSSHNSDLLDDKKIPAESILAVSKTTQGTQIGAIDEAGRSAIKDRLFTAGELLRANALHLPFDWKSPDRESLDLFAGMA